MEIDLRVIRRSERLDKDEDASRLDPSCSAAFVELVAHYAARVDDDAAGAAQTTRTYQRELRALKRSSGTPAVVRAVSREARRSVRVSTFTDS